MSRFAQSVTEGKSPRGAGPGEVVSTSTTAASSINPIPDGINEVDLIADQPTFIEVGQNPTSVTDESYRIPQETIVRIPVIPGDIISAVAAASGNLWVHPVA